jgi:hypothetical protein
MESTPVVALGSAAKALAKMEALKQKGLTQAAIDQFVNGAINILLSAAITAIP